MANVNKLAQTYGTISGSYQSLSAGTYDEQTKRNCSPDDRQHVGRVLTGIPWLGGSADKLLEQALARKAGTAPADCVKVSWRHIRYFKKLWDDEKERS